MHPVESSSSSLIAYNVPDWWAVTCADLEGLAGKLIGTMPRGWVRQGDNFIEICGEYGADARHLPQELTALAAATQRIKSSADPVSVLRAAAFYHLRFQRIHPLVEGNGRVGRLILAAQLQGALDLPVLDLLHGLKDWEADYNRVFASRESAVRFELLLDLLVRITGILLPPEATALPERLDPVHPQKRLPKQKGPRIAPRDAAVAKMIQAAHAAPAPSRCHVVCFLLRCAPSG
ncbi:MAG: Fic family protein, partial [Opitutaceae bacterium]|nr:Fic family protein [Opitutaceae bacterium]